MKRLRPFWLALILAAFVECVLVLASATFAFPYFDASGAQQDTKFVTFCRMGVAFMHLPTIVLAGSFPEGSRLFLPFIVVANVVFLTILFWFVIALARKLRKKPNAV